MRIVRVRSKGLYFAITWVASFLAARGLGLIVPLEIALIISTAITTAVFLGASRTFRGAGEQVEPPRPWWRMTSRPKGSLVLAILCTVGVLFSPLSFRNEHGLALFISDLALWMPFAVLFFISFARLRREKPAGWMLPTSAEWRPAPRPRALR